MPALQVKLSIEAGSYDPEYWTITDGLTRQPLDLTAPGYSVRGRVLQGGQIVLELADDTCWARTTRGRIYFQPSSFLTRSWPPIDGLYQAELVHPVGEAFRFAAGPFVVSADLSPSA